MIGKTYPSEMKRYKDEKTGTAVWQLTAGESNNYHFYFTDNSFTLGDREIYFLSDRGHRPNRYNCFRMDLTTGAITQVTDEPDGIDTCTKSPDSRLLVYRTGNRIKKMDTAAMVAEVIYEESGSAALRSPFISHDKKYVGLIKNESVDVPRGPNYKGFKSAMYAVKRGWITLIDLDGSKAVDVFEDTHQLGHFQFAPDDSTLAMFCHEGPWNLVHQRIWLIDLASGSVKPCFRQGEDDCVGHEFWTRDGLVFFDNRGKGHDGTITSDKTQATVKEEPTGQSAYIGFADRNGETIRTVGMPFYCNHYHANSDNTLLIGDEAEDIVMIDIGGAEPKLSIVCHHGTSWYTQKSHCHPTFGWDDGKILFTSDRGGNCHLYMVELC